MMIQKPFDTDIAMWRKRQDEVTKYFDRDIEGFKLAIDNVAKWTSLVTAGILNAHYMAHLVDGIGCAVPFQWKQVYHTLEKSTEGKSVRVIRTVVEEHVFEAWRQLNLRFELGLDAQTDTVLFELVTC